MKNILILVSSVLYTLTTSAQVLDIHSILSIDTPPNAYLKDMDNFFNQFQGTWKYQNGLEQLEVRFIKKEMMLRTPGPNQYYEDILVGEYKYIDSNGIEKVNSLSNLNTNHVSVFDYNLYSITKLNLSNAPVCPECPVGTERLYMMFDEPANDDMMLFAEFVMRRIVENGVEKLKVQFVTGSTASGRKKGDFVSPSYFRDFSLPYGNYILIKQ